MADLKITQLTELAATPDDADILAIVDDVAVTPITKKITVANLLAAAGGGAPTMKVSTDHSVAARVSDTSVGTGVTSYGSSGAHIETGATSGSSENHLFVVVGGNGDLIIGNPTISFSVGFSAFSTNASANGSSYWGTGTVTVGAAGHTFTNNHFGFKTVTVSGATSLYATQADGTTETVSGALTTVASGENFDLIIDRRGSDIDYYWRKDGGALSAATTLSTNAPGTGTYINTLQHSISNNNTAYAFEANCVSSSYER